uniref:HMG box domain-containing protein n=13 Tax=Dugesiidae TaxID=31262 RepID=A0A1S6KMJ0_SCHMD|nr:hypothetical protein Smed-tcf7 [Schmidtea mediterranea]
MNEYDPQNQYSEQSGLYRNSGVNYPLACNGPHTPHLNPLYGAPDFTSWQTAAAAAYGSPSSNIRSYYQSPANFISQNSGRFSPSLLNHQNSVQNSHFYGFPEVPGNPMSGIHNGQNLTGIPFSTYSGASSFRNSGFVNDPSRTSMALKLGLTNENAEKTKKPHIKKPLNAFMLFMKEMRAKVVAECTLKESAAINQILGRRWHALTREDQAKYYEMARKEKELHHQLYPGWSARDNYACNMKRKKKRGNSNNNNNNSKFHSSNADCQGYNFMKKEKYSMPSAQWFKQACNFSGSVISSSDNSSRTSKSSPSLPMSQGYFDGIPPRSILGATESLVNMSNNSTNNGVSSMISPMSGNPLGMLPTAGNLSADLDPYGLQYGAAALHNSLRQHQSLYNVGLTGMDAAISQAIKLEKFEGIISNSFMAGNSACDDRSLDASTLVSLSSSSSNNNVFSHTIMDLS